MFKLIRQVSIRRSPIFRTHTSSTKQPQEDPVIVVSKNGVDIIGPPDPVSNLRPIVRRQLLNETPLQQKLREMQESTQKWNQEFWAIHNRNFVEQRQKFIDKKLQGMPEKRQLTAEEMSDFYKSFLDKNWELHFRYNFAWYRRNFEMLFLSLRVLFER